MKYFLSCLVLVLSLHASITLTLSPNEASYPHQQWFADVATFIVGMRRRE